MNVDYEERIAWEALLTISKTFQHLNGWNMNKN
jgi:hypothetical protein